EDGIRDSSVTGVQTCALPIWSSLAAAACRESSRVLGIGLGLGAAAVGAEPVAVGDAARKRHVERGDLQELLALAGIAQALGRARSEERRVGEGGECGGPG